MPNRLLNLTPDPGDIAVDRLIAAPCIEVDRLLFGLGKNGVPRCTVRGFRRGHANDQSQEERDQEAGHVSHIQEQATVRRRDFSHYRHGSPRVTPAN